MKTLLALTSCLALLLLAGCAKPDLPDTIVRAGTEQEFATFRTELSLSFEASRLESFATALQELQLAGMENHPTADARAAAMRSQIHGRSVRAVEILGWQARHARFQSEIAGMMPTLEHDLRTREREGTATPANVLTRIQNVEDLLRDIRRHLAETEAQLAAWGAKPMP